MTETHEIPAANDEDYLERYAHYLAIASSFKTLMTDLATDDVSDSEYFGTDLQQADLDENGRLTDDFQIAEGHYAVLPGQEAAADHAEHLCAAVLLSRPDGGRRFNLTLYMTLLAPIDINYYEDTPFEGGGYKGTEDIFTRFRIEQVERAPAGIHPSDIKIVEGITTNVRALQAARRLVPTECKYS